MTDTTRPQERDFSEMLTKDNAALVMIDHQAGLMLFPGDIDPSALRMNAIALARTAKLFNLPVVLSAADQGAKGQSTLPIRRCFATSDCQRQSVQLFPKSKKNCSLMLK